MSYDTGSLLHVSLHVIYIALDIQLTGPCQAVCQVLGEWMPSNLPYSQSKWIVTV